jgi:hypothetical protein
MTQVRLENWLEAIPGRGLRATQFNAPSLPYRQDSGKTIVDLQFPDTSADVTTIVTVFYPPMDKDTVATTNLLTLSGIEGFRYAGRPQFFIAPISAVKELKINAHPLPNQPVLAILRIDNKAKTMKEAAVYDPESTFEGPWAGTRTSDLTENQIWAFLNAAGVPPQKETESLNIPVVARHVMEHPPTETPVATGADPAPLLGEVKQTSAAKPQ